MPFVVAELTSEATENGKMAIKQLIFSEIV
jgi:hypothetical protein